uniref:Putative neurotoxin LTDF S-12 n=1 Tax=Dolomedes fimbriatus TaxID=1432569 RepID=A0A0K1D8H0_9ARAC|nr:putative neurotoxin LTDF S-12 [Dolomedes fimbriatus]
MKLCIFFILLLITIVHCEDEILENESNAEETSAVVQEENARACTKWRMSCSGENDNSCCWPYGCQCWSQTVSKKSSRKERKCQCRLW